MEIKNVILDWGGIIIGINENNCVDAFNRIKAYGVAQSIADGRKDPIYTNFESTYFLQVIENEISFYLIKRRGYELEINRM